MIGWGAIAARHGNICSMTSQGRPLTRFRRALENRNLLMVHAAAAELPHIGLADALAITLLIEEKGEEDQYERAVVRWLGRFAMECRNVTMHDLRRALDAFEALPDENARVALSGLLSGHGLRFKG